MQAIPAISITFVVWIRVINADSQKERQGAHDNGFFLNFGATNWEITEAIAMMYMVQIYKYYVKLRSCEKRGAKETRG